MTCKNPGEWRLFGQPIGTNGEWLYIVGRQRDMGQPLHSGNIEYRGEYTNETEAEELRQRLIKGGTE